MTPEQRRRANLLVALYKQGDPADPVAARLLQLGDAAHRVTQATHTRRPAAWLNRHVPDAAGLAPAKFVGRESTAFDRDIGQAAAGQYHMGRAVGHDVGTMMQREPAIVAALRHGDFAALPGLEFPRTSGIVKGSVRKSVYAVSFVV